MVGELEAANLADAAAVVGRGMRDNPLHVRVFGDDDERRERALTRFFLPVLGQFLVKGTILGALRAGSLAGVCVMLPPGTCQPGRAERFRLLPGVIRASPGALVPLMRWARG